MATINSTVDDKIYRTFLDTILEHNKETKGIRSKAIEIAMLTYVLKNLKYRRKTRLLFYSNLHLIRTVNRCYEMLRGF